MRFLLQVLLLLYFGSTYAQIDTIFNSSHMEYLDESEEQCDSIIDIDFSENITCKLIFKQTDIHETNRIVISHTKIDVQDQSILFSHDSRFPDKILKLKYDTCLVRDFIDSDKKREFKHFLGKGYGTDSNNWLVEVNELGSHCNDTRYHEVLIKKHEDYISFNCIHNVKYLELDLNNDDRNELYLFSYIWCISEIRIYRIDILK